MHVKPIINMDAVMHLTRTGNLEKATKSILAELHGRADRHEKPNAKDELLLDLRRSGANSSFQDDDHGHPGRSRRLRGQTGVPRSVGLPVERSLPLGASFAMHSVRNSSGTMHYKLYIPSTYAQTSMPLVVMLHGCTQDADDFAAGTRMNQLAEAHDFLVAYPEQTHAANASRCWNWFRAGDQVRDGGEPSLIADATRAIIADFLIDPTRVFVAGLSAGGAAAAVMGCAYPDLYAGVGIHSGLACGAARDLPSAFAAMQGSPMRNRSSARNVVPTIVFHGTADRTVSPRNVDYLRQQAQLDDASYEHQSGLTEDHVDFERSVWRNADGQAVFESWLVGGAGHAWSGGSGEGSYSETRGPDASLAMLRFFDIAKT